MTCYASVEQNLREGMVQGQMHKCLRDIGRRAGGLMAGRALTQDDVDALGQLAESMSINKAEARRKWAEAVQFGSRSPLYWDEHVRQVREAHEIGWDSEIGEDDLKVVKEEWLEEEVIEEPTGKKWNPCRELTTYLNLMFEPDDIIGYCIRPFEKDGRFIPSNGTYDRKVADIVAQLAKGKFDDAIGTPNEETGGWIRINPLDGKGTKDVNVSDYRYALVESDDMEIEKQVAIYRQLELPCKCIVHSGGKSAHAIVKVFAENLDQYHKRVDFLFEVCRRNGLTVDRQNRNPSRYSRMPGLVRGEKKQYIIERECGKPNWEEWEDWIKDLNDDLPDFETLGDIENPPPLAPEQIEGILRVGHKMCIAGPSKAGKSFLLIELAIAVAEGTDWIGHKCRPGRVLYVNLEVDKNSCIHRFCDVYHSLGIKPMHKDMIECWHLRGRTMPLDKLAPKLIRRAAKMNFAIIIIDPIYKVLTGDENSASEMAAFCGHLDRVARDCNSTLVFCHHHSKGAQGGKRSMDRASGSGVFARDPDALIDLLPLESESARKVYSNTVECDAIEAKVKEVTYDDDWKDEISEDDQLVAEKFIAALPRVIENIDDMNAIRNARATARKEIESLTGWRASFTLREFAGLKEQNLWFRWPRHYTDDENLLQDCAPEGEEAPRGSYRRREKKQPSMSKQDTLKQTILFDPNRKWTVDEAIEQMKISESSFWRYMKKLKWNVENNIIKPSEGAK